jgi:hypothetical protein
MNPNVLIIFAKTPDPRSVKTRLKGHLTNEERVGLYEEMLRDTVQRLQFIPEVDTVICYTPESGEQYFSIFGLTTFVQKGNDLGERMYNAFEKVFKKGYKRAALVGVDIPGLNATIVSGAFRMLENMDVVFGPANDGGYYLVAMNSPLKDIFSGVVWSSERTLLESVKKAESLGLRVGFTEELIDIDTIDDLRYYYGHKKLS